MRVCKFRRERQIVIAISFLLIILNAGGDLVVRLAETITKSGNFLLISMRRHSANKTLCSGSAALEGNAIYVAAYLIA